MFDRKGDAYLGILGRACRCLRGSDAFFSQAGESVIHLAHEARFPVVHPAWRKQIVKQALPLHIRPFLNEVSERSAQFPKWRNYLFAPAGVSTVTQGNARCRSPALVVTLLTGCSLDVVGFSWIVIW